MSDRPIVRYQGKDYQRRSGGWVTAPGSIAAPTVVAAKLDALARKDPELWDLCCQQDWADAPAKRRAFRIGSDWSLRRTVKPETKRTRGSSASNGDRGHLMSADFKGERDLLLTCDIEAAWRRADTSWRIGESTTIDLPEKYSLRLRFELYEIRWNEWQRRFSGDWTERPGVDLDAFVPHFTKVERSLGPVECALKQGHCWFYIPLLTDAGGLNSGLSWRLKARQWQFSYSDCLHEDPVPIGSPSRTMQRAFRIELKASLKEPPPEPRRPLIERDLPMPSAGLPSLGKRR